MRRPRLTLAVAVFAAGPVPPQAPAPSPSAVAAKDAASQEAPKWEVSRTMINGRLYDASNGDQLLKTPTRARFFWEN